MRIVFTVGQRLYARHMLLETCLTSMVLSIGLIFDTNDNGFINRAEFGCVSYATFDLLDKDRDGRLTKHGYLESFGSFDTDHDGFITAAEFGWASYATFDLLDKDGFINRAYCLH